MAWSVQISREAAAALRALPDEERAAVERAIGRLVLGPTPPGFPEAAPLAGTTASERFALRAGHEYWVSYAVEPNDVIVVDNIISQETIQKYVVPVA